MKLFKKNISLTAFCLVLNLYTLVAFHAPFYKHLLSTIEPGWNGSFIVASMVLLMVAGNFFAYYLILSLGRFVGKCILAFTLVGDAIMLYFVRNFNVLVTDDMMGNVFNTQYSEASGFFSWALVGYVLVLGVLPCIYLFARKVDYDGAKKALGRIGIALGVVVVLVFGNITNWPWMDRNSTQLGSMLMPWSYTVNTFRYFSAERRRNVKEIPLEDPAAISKSRDVCVLIIGESARRDHFSLYGYERIGPAREFLGHLHRGGRQVHPAAARHQGTVRNSPQLPVPERRRCNVAHQQLGRAAGTHRKVLEEGRYQSDASRCG